MEEKERQERLEREVREQQERLEREKMQSQHEFEMRKLELLQVKLGSDPSVEKSSAKFDVTKHIKYFLHFEKVAGNLKSKEQLFDRWCHSQKVDKDHDKLRQLILIGEFERCIHSDVRTFIDEQRAETLEDEARLAEEFSLSHKVTFVEKPKRPYPPPGQDPPPTPGCFGNQRSHKSEDPRRKQNPGNNSANRSNVDVGNADPIKQHPYRLNPSKQKYLKEEIKYLLENNFIEPEIKHIKGKDNVIADCLSRL
ncbi:hypothetical protein P5673_015651 [Acropora cervicornis]|uniref:Uncharacterized protein n=1 Tax=Acropora cervicornis TaxID=6130 RepID=A0AAD9V559_ACRCE|nr:hypothetical protein P5673_015651 [Acropora cervicornis]